MDDDKILQITSEIEETLGKDSFAMISDKIGEILTGNTQNMNTIASKEKEISELQNRNEKLVTANGALLQKIPVEKIKNEPKEQESKEQAQRINLSDAFDAHGRFKR